MTLEFKATNNSTKRNLMLPDHVNYSTNNLKLMLDANEKLEGKTFLITGGLGNLATAFVKTLQLYVPSAKVFYPSKHDLDVEDLKSFALHKKSKVDYVLHCAGKINADFCESNRDLARKNLVKGTINTFKYATEIGAEFFFPQSFLIFDGHENPTTEHTLPNPISKYGELKLEAEQLINSEPNTLIVRCGGFFGGEVKDKNFVGKMYNSFSTALANGVDKIEVGDRIWQPTYTKDIAENVIVMMALGKKGTYNMASKGSATFFEVAQKMSRILKISHKIEVVPFAKNKNWSLDIAPRPKAVLMSNSRLVSEGIDMQRDWKSALVEYLSLPYFQKFESGML